MDGIDKNECLIPKQADLKTPTCSSTPCVFQDDCSTCLDKNDSFQTSKRTMEFPQVGNDNLRTVHSILSNKECDDLIDAVSLRGLTKPPLFDKSVRDCTRRHTIDVEMSNIIMPRLLPFLPEVVQVDGADWVLSRFTHHWRFVMYQEGGKFIPHWDGSKLLPPSSESGPEMTLFTVQFYLNDDFERGHTRFYLDYKVSEKDKQFAHDVPYGNSKPISVTDDDISVSVKPTKGTALIFNHSHASLLHDGEPVKSGVKYILRSDIIYSVRKEHIPRLLRTEVVMKEQGVPTTWCSSTAARYATKNFIGEVWVCWCALDNIGDMERISKPPFFKPEALCDICKACRLVVDETRDLPTEVAAVPVVSPVVPSSNFDNQNEQSTIINKETSALPKLILLSGKRACGKDYIGELLVNTFSQVLNVQAYKTSLGDVNKKICARDMGLDFHRLMTDREYKEQHRLAMVASHAKRDAADPLWCIREVLCDPKAQQAKLVVICDLRMNSDLDNLIHNQGLDHLRSSVIATLRIHASEAARELRGWRFHPIKDTLPTEIDLDTYKQWTSFFDNSATTVPRADAVGSAAGSYDVSESLAHEWIKNTVIPRVKHHFD